MHFNFLIDSGLYILITGIDGRVGMKLTFGIRVRGTKTKIRKENKVYLFLLLAGKNLLVQE